MVDEIEEAKRRVEELRKKRASRAERAKLVKKRSTNKELHQHGRESRHASRRNDGRKAHATHSRPNNHHSVRPDTGKDKSRTRRNDSSKRLSSAGASWEDGTQPNISVEATVTKHELEQDPKQAQQDLSWRTEAHAETISKPQWATAAGTVIGGTVVTKPSATKPTSHAGGKGGLNWDEDEPHVASPSDAVDTHVSAHYTFDWTKDREFKGNIIHTRYEELPPEVRRHITSSEWATIQKKAPPRAWLAALFILLLLPIPFLPLYLSRSLAAGCKEANRLLGGKARLKSSGGSIVTITVRDEGGK